MKKGLVLSGVCISGLFLWLALRHTNFSDIRQAFEDARLWPVFPMLACLFAFYWLKAIRWSVLLSPTHTVTSSSLVPAMMAGAAGNNLLPAHFGELVRVYFAGNKFGIPKSTVLATLVVERLFDIVSVLALLAVAFVTGDFATELYLAGAFLFFLAFIISLCGILLTYYSEQWIRFIQHDLSFLSPGVRQILAVQMQNLNVGLTALRTKNLYLTVLLNSLLQWSLMVGCIYCSLLAFDINGSPQVAIVILGLTVAGLSLPTSPGFFGTIEYCFVLGLATAGIEPSVAVSAAIYYHVPAWIIVTLTGVVLIRRNNYSLSQIKKNASI